MKRNKNLKEQAQNFKNKKWGWIEAYGEKLKQGTENRQEASWWVAPTSIFGNSIIALRELGSNLDIPIWVNRICTKSVSARIQIPINR